MFTSKTPRSTHTTKKALVPTTPTTTSGPRTAATPLFPSTPSYFGKTSTPSGKRATEPFILVNNGQERYVQSRNEKTHLDQNERHIIEQLAPFPKELRDTITAHNLDLSTCDSYVDEQGYCVFTSNPTQSLFVWHVQGYKDALQSSVFHVELPASNQQYSAKLANISNARNSRTDISLLVATKEGILRLWPNLNNQRKVFVDTNIPLEGGKYLTQLISCGNFGWIAGSSTGTLYQIQVTSNYQVHWKQLQAATSSMLYGLGSLFWGKTQASPVKQIIIGNINEDTCEVFVMTQDTIQKWIISGGEKERMEFSYDLLKEITSVLQKDEEERTRRKLSLKTWLLDIKFNTNRTKLYVLVASALDSSYNEGIPLITYSIVELRSIRSENDSSQQNLVLGQAFSLLYEPAYTPESEAQLARASLHLLEPAAYVVLPDMVILTQVPVDERPLDAWSSRKVEDSLVGAGVVVSPSEIQGGAANQQAVLVTLRHGLLSVLQFGLNANMFEEESISPLDAQSLSLDSLDKAEARRYQLSHAFNAYVQGDKKLARSICAALETLPTPYVDEIAIQVGSLLLDAFPKNDPRWAEEKNDVNSVTSSLLLRHQLEEKRQRFKLYTEFLSACRLLKKLSEPGAYQLQRLEEKLNAAMNLRNYQNTLANDRTDLSATLLFRAMEQLQQSHQHTLQHIGLGPQDHFYGAVSRMEEILPYLQALQGNNDSEDPFNVFLQLNEVNQIFEVLLASFSPTTVQSTIHNSELTIRQVTENQIKKGFDFLKHAPAIKPEQRTQLFNQLYVLTDFVLQAYSVNEDVTLYVAKKSELIQPFEEQNQTSLALRLAEKHKDFGILVRLCSDDSSKIEAYMHMFRDEGFAQVLFKYYLDQGAYAALLSQPPAYHKALAEFLHPYPHLAWLHSLRLGEHAQASATFYGLGLTETFQVPRRKTLLSLSKLAARTAVLGDPNTIAQVEPSIGAMIHATFMETIPMLPKDETLVPVSTIEDLSTSLLNLIRVQSDDQELSQQAPLSPDQLIHHFLQPTPIPLENILKALAICQVASPFLTLPQSNGSAKDQLQQALFGVWFRVISSNPWEKFALEMSANENITDSIIERTLKQTPFFEAATNPEVVTKGLAPYSLLEQVREQYQRSIEEAYPAPSNAGPAASRLLEALFTLLKRQQESLFQEDMTISE